MASLAAPSGGIDLELRVAADAAAVRLMLAQVSFDAMWPQETPLHLLKQRVQPCVGSDVRFYTRGQCQGQR
jgi:hypothetical protein